jgi:transcription initiation factor TFIIB
MAQGLTNPHLSAICFLCNTSAYVINEQEFNETVCSNCGSIITDRSNDTDKQRNYPTKEDNTNPKFKTVESTAGSLAIHDMGLPTTIGKTNRDASGRLIDAEMKNRINRWRVWETRSRIRYYRERNLSAGLMQLQRAKDKLVLPNSVIEKTVYIYRKTQQRGLTIGTSTKVAITAALYVACRELEIPRTIKELAEIADIDEKGLSRFYRKTILELDLKVPPADPLRMVIKIANICKTSEKTKRNALQTMKGIMQMQLLTSKDPMGLAGAAVYLAAKKNGERITQFHIVNATGVTLVTLRNDLRFIEKIQDLVKKD